MTPKEHGSWTDIGARLRHLLRENRNPLLIFVITRLGLFLLAYLSLAVLPLNTDPNIADPEIGLWRGFPQNRVLDGWARWDSAWYKNII